MDYEKASSDLKRYLPLKIATLIWFVVVFGAEAIAEFAATIPESAGD